jgi:hypothetical protein
VQVFLISAGVQAVIARSEATTQSSHPLCRAMDCFASLAMTDAFIWSSGVDSAKFVSLCDGDAVAA